MESEPDDGEERAKLAERVETLTAAAYTRGDLALLDPLREAVTAIGEPVDARGNRAVAGALLVVYKLSHRLDELALALAALERVHATWPTDAAANNLASALLETCPPRGDIQRRAATDCRLLACRRSAANRHPLRYRRGRLGHPEHDVIERSGGRTSDGHRGCPGRRGRLRRLVACLTAWNVAGVRIRRRSTSWPRLCWRPPTPDAPDGDLDLAVELLERSLALTEADHLDRPARVGNLASVLIDRFERGVGGPEGLDRAVALAREAVADLDELDPRQPTALNVLTNGLTASWQYLGGEAVLREALGYLPLFIAHALVAGPWAATFMENAALLAFNAARTFRDEDSDELLDLAIDLLERSIGAVEPGCHAWATRQGALGGVLAERYHRTRDAADLEAALAVAAPRRRRRASGPTRVGHPRYDAGQPAARPVPSTGHVSILDSQLHCIASALDTLVDDAPGSASFLNNLSIVVERSLRATRTDRGLAPGCRVDRAGAGGEPRRRGATRVLGVPMRPRRCWRCIGPRVVPEPGARRGTGAPGSRDLLTSGGRRHRAACAWAR